jgi:chitin disaccharide deacetylase
VHTVKETLERLGLGPATRAVIISCTNLGEHHAATSAVVQLQAAHPAISAGLKVPCPWARHAAALHRGGDVGVRLTVNAEHDIYRWGPITQSPSLLDGNGGFPGTLEDLWDHADLDEVRRECRAQVERAILWGFDVTHLSSHFDALLLRPEFFDVALDLAVEFDLPLEMPDEAVLRRAGFRLRELAAEENLVFAGRVVELDQELEVPRHASGRTDVAAAANALRSFLSDLEPGVTVLRISPAIDTPEHRALTTSTAGISMYETVMATLAGLTHLPVGGTPADHVRLITYRDLRAIQRRR